MKTFRTLLIGWTVGGAAIVLCSFAMPSVATAALGRRPVNVQTVQMKQPTAEAAVAPQSDLLIPVLGVTADQLHDDFNQPRSNGRTHGALDILAPRGTPVLAATDGTIRKLFLSNAGGITIYQFDRDEERVYYYAHLDRYADGLAEGLFVRQGTVIGYVGATGNAHGTNHLHFAVEVLPPTKEWWKGTPVDPYPLLATNLSALP